MHPAVKILIGLVLIVVGFGLFVDSIYDNMWTGLRISWWHNFLVVLTGVIPALLILVGLFVVWLEADELKADKEIKSEKPSERVVEEAAAEEKPKPARPARRKKR